MVNGLPSKISIILLIGLLLSACSTYTPPPPDYVIKEQQQQAMIKALAKKYDVKVVVIGEQVTIVIPQYQIFLPDSDIINLRNRVMLNTIVELIQSYSKVVVKVTAYPPCQSQAETLALYLWERDIDARLLETVVEGDQPIYYLGPRIRNKFRPNSRPLICTERHPAT